MNFYSFVFAGFATLESLMHSCNYFWNCTRKGALSVNQSESLNHSGNQSALRIANAVLKELDGATLLGLLGLIAVELGQRVKTTLFRMFNSTWRRGEL